MTKETLDGNAIIGVDIQEYEDHQSDDLAEMNRWNTGLILPKDVPGINDELKNDIQLLRELLKTSIYYKLLRHGTFYSLKTHVPRITENINEMYTLFKNSFKGPNQ